MSDLLGYDAASLGNCCPLFLNTLAISSEKVEIPKFKTSEVLRSTIKIVL
jgi:hypothetical protein